MTVIDDLLKPETRRNRWGQYLVVPPEGGEPVGYIRATTIAKTLDDGSGLIGWGKRMVALGLSQRPDLLALIATTDDTDKRALDKVCERAAEAGGSTIRRDLGTAFHSAMEASYESFDAVPAAFLEDVVAVHEALKAAGLSVVPGLVERIVVHDRHRIGGTFDLVLTDGERNYISDIKTGSSVAYGSLGFAVQLAIYANADAMYAQGHKKDGSADTRQPMPDLDKSKGIILHAQLGEAKCDLHWIDLEIGAKALDLAMTVREIRKSKPLTPIVLQSAEERMVEKVKAAFPGAEEIVGEEWRGWFRARLADISEAGHLEQLRVGWPAGVPTLASGEDITAEQAEQLEQMTADIEAEFGLSFPAPKPRKDDKADKWVSRIAVPDVKPNEGPTLGKEAVAAVNQLASALDADARKWMADMLTAATKAKSPIRISRGGQPTKRKVAICTALALVASLGPDFAVAIAETASNRQVDERGFAHFLGGLSIEEAQRMGVIANGIHDGQIAASIALDGSVQLLETDVRQVLAP